MDITVQMLHVGLFVQYQGKHYFVMASRAFQEISPDSGTSAAKLPKPVITVEYDLLPITGEGEETGEPTISVRADISEFSI